MAVAKERYIVNEKGERIGVLLDIEEYKEILEKLEELDEIRAYDEAKESEDEAIPFEEALKEMERKRDKDV